MTPCSQQRVVMAVAALMLGLLLLRLYFFQTGGGNALSLLPQSAQAQGSSTGTTKRRGCTNPNQLALLEASPSGAEGSTPSDAASGLPPRAFSLLSLRGGPSGAEALQLAHSRTQQPPGAGEKAPGTRTYMGLGASFGPGLPGVKDQALVLSLSLLSTDQGITAALSLESTALGLPPGSSGLGPLDLALACLDTWNATVQAAPAPPPLPQPGRATAFLVQRGNCSFVEKALVVQAAGGSAVLVANTDDELLAMGCNVKEGAEENVSIPVVLIARSSAEALEQALLAGPVSMLLYAPPRTLLDPSEAFLWVLAVSLLVASAAWQHASAREEEGEQKRQRGEGEEGQSVRGGERPEVLQEINMFGAVSFVVTSSLVLLFLFFFMSPWLFQIILLVFCFMALEAVSFCFASFLYFWGPESVGGLPLWSPFFSFPGLGPVSPAQAASTVISLLLVVFWGFNRHASWAWLLQDLLGSCLILTVLQSIRLPNIKICSVLLVLAFFYDIFWVFISPYFFSGESVMVEVASGKRTGGEQLPLVLLAPHFLGPWEGASILGFGDVVLPGLLLAFTKRFDLSKRQGTVGYWPWTMCGYCIGLIATYVALFLMDGQGQPALLYLVPCTLGVVIFLGWRRSELLELWTHGTPPLGHSTRSSLGCGDSNLAACSMADEERVPLTS